MAAEEPDAAQFAALSAQPDEARVPDHLHAYWKAFWRLDGDRPLHPLVMSVGESGLVATELVRGAIPWSAIDRYAERFGYADDEYLIFLDLLEAMDDEALKVYAELRQH